MKAILKNMKGTWFDGSNVRLVDFSYIYKDVPMILLIC